MKQLVLAVALVPLAACAASSTGRGPEVASPQRSGLAIALVADDAARPSFPRRLTAADTRGADRLAHRVAAELGGQAHARLRLCVGGDGAVTSAELARGSGIAELDAALVDEARRWRYEPLALASATACQQVELSYRAH